MPNERASLTPDEIRDAVAMANIPTLIPMLVQMTGDEHWLEEQYRPRRPRGIANSLGDNDDGGLPPELQEEIRGAAIDAIAQWIEHREVAIAHPSGDFLTHLLGISMMEEIPSDYGPILQNMLGIRDDSPSAVRPPDGFHVLIVGAGASGLAMGVELLRAGITFTIVEKGDAVGGTWWSNRYPGCGVDTPSHLYSFSFYPYDWPAFFSLRDELQGYFDAVATDCGLRPFLRLQTEVVDARYSGDDHEWDVLVRSSDGGEEHLRADVLITAVGVFGRPNPPDLPGVDEFEGAIYHTARWPEGVDLAGKRVALIGNGASAMQTGPAIVDEVESLVVLQRTPQWIAPFEKFGVQVPEPVRKLILAVPLYREWYRLRLFWTFNDRVHPALVKDPEWTDPDRSLNRKNDRQRQFFEAYIREQLGDREDLIASNTPDYPPFGKRMLFDNGWYQMLRRDHVTLNTSSAARLTSNAVVGGDGQSYEVDAVIFATGFDAVSFLSTLDVVGPSGRSLADVWEGDNAHAYMGLVVPEFPNLFLLYGPNVQAGHGGSILNKLESQTHWIRGALEYMIANDLAAIECRQEVCDTYNDEVDEAHVDLVWTHPRVTTYYRNSRGRLVVNSPFRGLEFMDRMERISLDDDFIHSPRQVRVDA